MMFLKSFTEFSFDGLIPETGVSDWQLILPVGKFKTVKYGDLNITEEFVLALYENWKNKVMGERQPFIDTDHNLSISNGWIVELRADPDGLRGRIEWTDVGRENVGQKRYRYFSAMIGRHKDLKGEDHYPVLMAVSLTNTPQMENMPAVSLNDKSGAQDAGGASGDRGRNGAANTNPRGGKIMDYKELLKLALELKLSDTEKAEFVKALGIEPPKAPVQTAPAAGGAEDKTLELTTKVETLELANKDLTSRVEVLTKDIQTRNENDIITLALKEGRMLPVDEKKYRELYKKAPDVVGPIIAGLPVAIDLSVHGSGAGGAEGEAEYKLTAEDREAMEVAGMNEDEYRESIGKKKPAAAAK